jgi:hypothetical protein
VLKACIVDAVDAQVQHLEVGELTVLSDELGALMVDVVAAQINLLNVPKSLTTKDVHHSLVP